MDDADPAHVVLYQLRSDLGPVYQAGVFLLVQQEDDLYALGEIIQCFPAHDLVMVHLRDYVMEGRGLGVLVYLAFPAVGGHRQRSLHSVDDGHFAIKSLSQLFGVVAA